MSYPIQSFDEKFIFNSDGTAVFSNNFLVSGNISTDSIDSLEKLSFSNTGYIATGKIYDSSNFVSIDWQNRGLRNTFNTVLDWQNSELKTNLGEVVLDWNNYLFRSDDANSIDWFDRYLYDRSEIISIDWNSRILSGNWNAETLTVGGQNVVTSNQTGVFESSSHASSTYATITNLTNTGSSLNTNLVNTGAKITALSGFLINNYPTSSTVASTYATISNLTSTGVTLFARDTTISGILQSNINIVQTNLNTTNTNLASTGSNLQAQINTINASTLADGGTISGNLAITGSLIVGLGAGVYTFQKTITAGSNSNLFAAYSSNGAQFLNVGIVSTASNFSVAKSYTTVHQISGVPSTQLNANTGPHGSNDFTPTFSNTGNSGVYLNIGNSGSISSNFIATLFLGAPATVVTL